MWLQTLSAHGHYKVFHVVSAQHSSMAEGEELEERYKELEKKEKELKDKVQQVEKTKRKLIMNCKRPKRIGKTQEESL